MKKQLTEEQKSATEARRAKFRELVGTIAQMGPDARAQFAARAGIVTAEGRPLSVFNQCLVASQMPSASIVGGFAQWRAQGRMVRKGSAGLAIWFPKSKKAEATDEGKDDAAEPAERPLFAMGYVFDITQTEAMAETVAA
jgi:hypothetical protein